jgi:hypothetical protein
MQYLITTNIQQPFLTKWFDADNHFNPDVEMVVYDLINNVYTTDGHTWLNINIDHL